MFIHVRMILLLCIIMFLLVFEINGISKKFNPSIVEELKEYGRVASINYRISIKGTIPEENARDLRLKIWVCAHISYKNSNEVLFTIMRLDNVMNFNETSQKRNHQIDYIWKDTAGWDEPLDIWIKNVDTHIEIPLNVNFDVYQMKVENISLLPSPISTSEIPKVLHYNVGDHVGGIIAPILVKTSSTARILNPHYLIKTITADLFPQFMFEKEGVIGRESINGLQPLAFKTDLYRLVQIYHDGGLYLDTRFLL